MKRLLIYLEINGKQKLIGDIIYNSREDAGFAYTEEYLQSETACPISISLPLQRERFSTQRTKNFFEGLLPEGFTRRTVARWMHVSEDDYLAILIGLGNECLGAVRVLEEDAAMIAAGYEKLDKNQIVELAKEGATKSTEMVTKSHLSLTGASGKVGLYYDDINKQWFLPHGEAPSTHIVKQSHVRMNGIVTNEQLCLLTAKKLGIEIPQSFIINTGDASEEAVLFATKRYDRLFVDESETLDGLNIPFRLHQEDFAQAMGKTSFDKYEKENEGYLQEMFKLLMLHAKNPIKEQIKLWNIMVYDYLVGNTDNHIKNFSLLYSTNLKGIELAPAYDIISTTIYESSTRDMGIAIGGKIAIDEINSQAFEIEAQKIGMNRKLAMQNFDKIASGFEIALKETAKQLKNEGFHASEDICEKILRSGGIAKI